MYYCAGDEGRVLWLGGCGPVFDSAPTAATSSVLEAELGSCQELLEMEPGNKCIAFQYPYIHPLYMTFTHHMQGVFSQRYSYCKLWTGAEIGQRLKKCLENCALLTRIAVDITKTCVSVYRGHYIVVM